jgi:hypothetical protein
LQQDINANKRIYEVLRSEAECFRSHPQYQNIAHQQKLSTQSTATRQGCDDGDGDNATTATTTIMEGAGAGRGYDNVVSGGGGVMVMVDSDVSFA